MIAKFDWSYARILLMAALVVAVPAFAHPGSGIYAMDNGEVYFSDTGHGIWKIDKNGDVTSHARADGHFFTAAKAAV